MNFEKGEKLAILRLLEKVAKADDQIVEDEMQILIKAARYLKADDLHIQASKDMSLQEAGRILRSLTPEKKQFISTTLIQLMAADGYIDPKEVQAIMETLLDEGKSKA